MNKNRVYSLDILRVLCTLCVFLCHASFLLPSTINDYIGALTGFVLELFFILSGFVAAVTWNDQPKYFQRKLLRVWPLHFAMYLACFVLQYLYSPEAFSFIDSVKQTVVNLLLLQSWTPNEVYVYSYNGVTWFLSSLFFCYLFTPFAIRIIRKHIEHAGFLVAAIISIRFLYVICFNSFIGEGGFCYTNVFPPYRFLEYALGMTIGTMHRNIGKRSKNSFLQVAGAACFLLVFVLLKRNGEIWNVSKMLIFFELFLVYTLAFYEGVLDVIAKWKPIQYLNKISLPFFLAHQVVIKYVRYFAGKIAVDLTNHSELALLSLFLITLLICGINETCVRLVSKK